MEETQVEDVHLETAEGPKPIVEWGQPGAPEPPANELEPETTDEKYPQVFEYDDGSSITIESPELTNRGWRATADAGTGKPPEVFYGNTKDELLQNVLVGKLNATRKINELKQATLDAGPKPPAEVSVTPNRLSADELFDFKAKFEENPDAALEAWYMKRTGQLPERTAAVAERGNEVAAENAVTEILTDWVRATDDYVVDARNRDNILGWLLRHKAKENPSAHNVESALDTLYRGGWLTPDYLTLAWDELKEDGAAVVENEPALPEPRPTATRPRAGFGVRTRGTMPTRTQASPDGPLTEAQLNQLPDEEIKKLYHGILEMNRTPAGKAAIQDSIQKIREGRR